jgi:hypothetical protein
MIGRKVAVFPNHEQPRPGPEAVDKGPADEFDSQAEEASQGQDTATDLNDLKPGSQPDGTASGVGHEPTRDPGIEQTDEAGRSSPIDDY